MQLGIRKCLSDADPNIFDEHVDHEGVSFLEHVPQKDEVLTMAVLTVLQVVHLSLEVFLRNAQRSEDVAASV